MYLCIFTSIYSERLLELEKKILQKDQDYWVVTNNYTKGECTITMILHAK